MNEEVQRRIALLLRQDAQPITLPAGSAEPIMGVAPSPQALKFLADKKGIHTLKEQAKRLDALRKQAHKKGETLHPLDEWLNTPAFKPK